MRSRTSLTSSPGSMTMASWEVSSPITEQLHCKGPTRSISWIIYLLIVARSEGETPSRQSAGAGAAVLGSARALVVGTCAGNASGRQYCRVLGRDCGEVPSAWLSGSRSRIAQRIGREGWRGHAAAKERE